VEKSAIYQQENFKEWLIMVTKLLVNFKYQFIDPFKVWHHEGVNYCLDGRHRFLDLKRFLNQVMFQKNYQQLLLIVQHDKLRNWFLFIHLLMPK
jgi:hypothetical protein